MRGPSCCSACNTGPHITYGACLRAQSIRVGDLHVEATKKNLSDCEAYIAAKKQGVQPDSTRRADVERALKTSETTGTAYQAR